MTNTPSTTRLDSVMGWQPIESVPRDGTWFVAARFVKGCRHARYGYAMVDRWHGREINKDDSYTGLGRFNKEYWPATHWMPLPPPPVSEGEKL